MRLVAACAAALVVCGTAAAALPKPGTLVPGTSLAGIRLGDTNADVRKKLGESYGICKGCAVPTWYFTYRAFDRRGLAVELTGGRVSAVYTLWRPAGWNAPQGLRLGAVEAQVSALAAGPLLTVACSGYDARINDRARARTVYYIVDGRLWGFGLMQARANPCR
jgi:hypothetical protein